MRNENCVFKKLFVLILLVSFITFSQLTLAQDKFLDLLKNELFNELSSLSSQPEPPYYISYRVDEIYSVNVRASFGDITFSNENKERLLTVSIRVGNHELDNSHELRDDFGSFFSSFGEAVNLPIEDSLEDGIRQIIWKETDTKYREAVNKLAKVKANIAVKVAEEDKSPDFSHEQAYSYYEPAINPDEVKIDRKIWEEKVKKYSKPFLDDPSIFEGYSEFRFKIVRKYFVSSEGSKIAQNLKYTYVYIGGRIKAEDGMVLPLHKTYFAFEPRNLPFDEEINEGVRSLVETLKALKNAPVVEPYTGPALLTGGAAGVFFHEIFGHRIEGQRQKSVTDGQTFKKKIGEKVLPEEMSVIMDPSMEKYKEYDLNGSYKFDDQGIKGQKVVVVKDGILRQFLMTRCPIENFPVSNGHARAEPGRPTVSRQSNLVVETRKSYSMEELRKMLIEEARKQGHDHGYLFVNVRGGFTMTGRFIPNAFNITPTEVYRVYVDGRPDELVRGVDLVGTPLSMFSQIVAAGDNPEIFTGTCGAESGRIPVTAISPALFVKQIEMQKKMKSQDRPIILPRPDTVKDKKF